MLLDTSLSFFHNVIQLSSLKITHTTNDSKEHKIKHSKSKPYHETTFSVGLEGASLYKVPCELIDPSDPGKLCI